MWFVKSFALMAGVGIVVAAGVLVTIDFYRAERYHRLLAYRACDMPARSRRFRSG